ncbi:hypothetical protein D1816_08340 [Aquimarina sp. AD10]|uniref:Viral A-type inclusion protein n=1 Tax=Aquimarina aggregata TaxID=1642818 RepID=A0A162XVG5_9FLAO|nr:MULTISPECIES: hypothetical protein [Aquimarina]AXT60358.1 hypothetical protein D1816_08340 [Aquimarina sp. AD10]KZS38795.1 hypothetical protein AWE51_14520 [Aquimarina aggregata]RKN01208.1 hypothetical protein D7033_05140 [Aquimarina sp. AD10]
MKLPIIYTLVSAVILLTSCNQLSKEEQEFDAIMENVIIVHDEVMPKMTELSSLIKNLDPKIDTTAVGKSHAKAQQDLKDSYDFMMEWMRDFSEKFPHTEEKLSPEKMASQMNLLKKEEIEVKQLRDQINTSIANAKSLLEK